MVYLAGKDPSCICEGEKCVRPRNSAQLFAEDKYRMLSTGSGDFTAWGRMVENLISGCKEMTTTERVAMVKALTTIICFWESAEAATTLASSL